AAEFSPLAQVDDVPDDLVVGEVVLRREPRVMHRHHLADLNIPQHSRGLRAGAGRREPGANRGLLALQVLEVLKNEALLPSSDEGRAFRRHQTLPDFIWISPEVIVPHRTTHSERLASAPREHCVATPPVLPAPPLAGRSTPVDTAKIDRRTVELSLPKSAYYAAPKPIRGHAAYPPRLRLDVGSDCKARGV